MLVVHLTASTFYGGPERQILGLSDHLPPPLRTRILSFRENDRCVPFLTKARERGHDARMMAHDTPHLHRAVRELVKQLRPERPAVLCCHGYKSNLVGMMAARWLRIPAISVSRGWTAENFKVRLYESLDRRVLPRMDHVVSVSAAQEARVRRTGVRPRRSSVIHNAIDARRFRPRDEAAARELRSGFPNPVRFLVGAAGRLSPEKGFDVLIDAAARVRDRCPGCAFLLFGEGAQRPALEDRIRTYRLEDTFRLAGFQAGLDALLPNLDLFVLSSFTEGLPNVVLEAMAAGTPVIATPAGGTPELIDDGQTGLLVPVGDADALAERVARIADDDALRVALAARARERVTSTFTFDAQAARYQELFARLAA